MRNPQTVLVAGVAAVALVLVAARGAGAHHPRSLPSARAVRAQEMRTTTSARQLQGERQLAVQLQYGAGRLRVLPGRGDLLYRMDLRYDPEKFRPVSEYDRASGHLKLGVENREHHHGHADHVHGQSATIELTPQVPMELELQFGAGEADVDLGGLALQDVHVETGASRTAVSFTQPNRVAARRVRIEAGAAEIRVNGLGNTRADRFEFSGGMGQATLDFSGAWSHGATAAIQMGIGSVRLRIPRSLGVRIVKDSFLTSFDGSGMVKRGNAWFSRNYDQAANKLDISISAAMGSIGVDWID